MQYMDIYGPAYTISTSGTSNELPKQGKCVYSDRMYQWNPDKYNMCALEVFGDTGQFFYNRSNEDIEKFISMYLGYKVVLLAVHVEDNASNGYPYWVFLYEEV